MSCDVLIKSKEKNIMYVIFLWHTVKKKQTTASKKGGGALPSFQCEFDQFNFVTVNLLC